MELYGTEKCESLARTTTAGERLNVVGHGYP